MLYLVEIWGTGSWPSGRHGKANPLHVHFCPLFEKKAYMFQVVWRYAGDAPADAPKNVKLMKWLPQKDLLGMFTLTRS